MLSSQQLSLLLAAFEKLDPAHQGWIPAGEVNGALKAAGILSTAAQDEALLLLHIDALSGRVSYDRLREQACLAQPRTSAATSIPQQDLVFKLTRELRELYNRFDIGSLPLSGLRENLAKLGFHETKACADLFRHSYEMTFNQLVQALARVDAPTEVPNSVASFKAPLNASPSTTRGMIKSGEAMPRTLFPSLEPTPKDRGLVRQQVHAAIRLLDGGEIDESAFVRRLGELGLELPDSSRRLLELHKAGTRVSFKDWIRTFEPYFAAIPVAVDENNVRAEPNDDAAAWNIGNSRGAHAKSNQRPSIFEFEYSDQPGEVATNLAKKHWSVHHQRIPFSYDTVDDQSLIPTERGSGSRGAVRPSAERGDAFRHMIGGKGASVAVSAMPIRMARAPSARNVPPFAFEGEVAIPPSITGVSRSPEKRTSGRVPFGTEADYAASFANGYPPHFG
jgi:Ca2+-binding EF-hand superfamily protein